MFDVLRVAKKGPFRRRLAQRAAWVTPLLVSGCTTFHPKPLPTAPDLARSPALTVPISEFNLPGIQPHPFNPAKGLDETTVMTLAVVNNPDLKAQRLQAGVARAQVLEAGILPDPVVSGGLSKSASITGYNVGLSEDIQALITRGAAKAAAKARQRQVNLEILWQEWQVAEQARELFIQARADAELEGLLTTNADLLSNQYRQDQAALERNNMTAGAVMADFAALSGAEAQLRQIELQLNQTRHALNQLLGLRPDTRLRLIVTAQVTAPDAYDRSADALVRDARKPRSRTRASALRSPPGQLPLIGGGGIKPLSAKAFQSAVAALPHRRADLLALRAGYQSQEQLLREAILAQFPSMSAGVQRSKSAEEGVYASGFTVQITLPLFNRNRGQIGIQRATRAVLYQTYQARLDQAGSQADQVWRATRIMARQLENLVPSLPSLQRAAMAAERSYRQGNLALDRYVTQESSFLTQQAAAVRLKTSLQLAQSALLTLLGLPPSNG
jgi:outer membrane protein, heavy metal efflux system